MTTIVALVLVAAVAYRVIAPDTRDRLLQNAVFVARALARYGDEELAPFRTALRSRTRFAIATAALAVVNAVVFGRMLASAPASNGTATLLAWGASFGPRTTNGEWWRLVTATFVHRGVVSLVLCTVALAQAGLIAERLAGPLTFTTAYLAAGVFASLASIATQPTSMVAGSAGAVFGIYGLVLTLFVAGRCRRSAFAMPAVALLRLAPGAAVFAVDALVEGTGALAASAAACVGALFGLLAVGPDLQVAAVRRTALAGTLAAAVAVFCAIPLRGFVDTAAELQRILALEHKTASSYQEAVIRFRKGTMAGDAVAQLIDQAIVPELEAADARVAGLEHVPPEDERRIANGRVFLRLRLESWQLRAKALRMTARPAVVTASRPGESAGRVRAESQYRSTLLAQGRAEAAERAAMDAMDRLSGDSPQSPRP